MSCTESVFPPLATTEASLPARAGGEAKVIDTVGVEILDDPPCDGSIRVDSPANSNDCERAANPVIPFASTLRRVG